VLFVGEEKRDGNRELMGGDWSATAYLGVPVVIATRMGWP